MHGAKKGLNELCGMLKIAEADIKKGPGTSHVMAVLVFLTHTNKSASARIPL
jgi:hypothetical protein